MKLYTIELRQNMGTYKAFKCDIGIFDRKPVPSDINIIMAVSTEFSFMHGKGCSMADLLSIGSTGDDKYGFKIKELMYTALPQYVKYMVSFKILYYGDNTNISVINHSVDIIRTESVDHIIDKMFNISYEKYEVQPEDIKELRECMKSEKKYTKEVKLNNHVYVLTVDKIGI